MWICEKYFSHILPIFETSSHILEFPHIFHIFRLILMKIFQKFQKLKEMSKLSLTLDKWHVHIWIFWCIVNKRSCVARQWTLLLHKNPHIRAYKPWILKKDSVYSYTDYINFLVISPNKIGRLVYFWTFMYPKQANYLTIHIVISI